DEDLALREDRLLPGPRVLEERDAPVPGADDEIREPVAVPVGDERPGVSLDLERRAARREVLVLPPRGLLLRPLVGDEPHVPLDVAHEEVHETVPVPVEGVHARGGPGDRALLALGDLDRLPVELDHRPLGRLLEVSVPGDEDLVSGLLDATAYVDDLAGL